MRSVELVEQYAQALEAQFSTGHAKEHAYRPALERLMSSFEDIVAVNDPKRSAHGNPDFVFLKRSNQSIILGYAEAKDVDISLDKTEKTNQMLRYAGYENLFLTNYLEFRFFQNGNKYQTVIIGEVHDGKLTLKPTAFGQLADELSQFTALPPESIKSGKRLSQIMGAKARRIRDNVAIYLKHEENEQNKELEKIYGLMKDLLVHDLSPDKFADMYAQTLVYGLFVARYSDTSPESFTRSEARDLVPASNPFLREFFDHIVGPRFDKRLAYIVDELCEVFSVSDVHNLIQKHLRLFEVDNEKDPIIHFYEDFLKEYDPEERKRMGAYYTPIPVVRFIIKQVDEMIKSEFGLAKGLADNSKRPFTIQSQGTKHKIDMHRVQILDPAVGTATFLNETIKYIQKSFVGQEGRWPSYAKQDLLPRLYGFELMMAPYTIAHLKLGMTLQDAGVEDFTQRLGVYLTNTLDEGIKHQQDLFSIGLAEVVTQESQKAAEIKHERPIMVIIGNPPYSGESSNKTEYANKLVSKYKYEPGGTQKLQERNPKWINDDYVKFIAFAEDMIMKNGDGVMAMITNHAYLDNPTFRGMRWHLAKTFDKIYILDLHGSTKKMEVALDGGKDENVFDIQQGVAIIVAVKSNNKRSNVLGTVHHADIFGTRKTKFSALSDGDINWQEVELDKKMYYFATGKTEGKKEYDKGTAVDDLFIANSVGVVTAADSLLVNSSRDELIKNLRAAKESSDDKKINQKLSKHDISEQYIKPIAYRPFDKQYIYYSPELVERSRGKIMSNYTSEENVGLMVCRQQKTDGFYHALVHTDMAESSYVSNKTSEIGYSFPLYLYHDDGSRTVNFKPDILKNFTAKLSGFEPEDILDYVYAVLYSPSYRAKYKHLLKGDFPKIPAPKDDRQFRSLAKLGSNLRKLHLLTDESLSSYTTTYPVGGTNLVEDIKYWPATTKSFWKDHEDEATVHQAESVSINSSQYFGNVPEVAWNFSFGGYQPAQKWLKDRKGKELTNEEIEHYQKIIKSLVETDETMQKIDALGLV